MVDLTHLLAAGTGEKASLPSISTFTKSNWVYTLPNLDRSLDFLKKDLLHLADTQVVREDGLGSLSLCQVAGLRHET